MTLDEDLPHLHDHYSMNDEDINDKDHQIFMTTISRMMKTQTISTSQVKNGSVCFVLASSFEMSESYTTGSFGNVQSASSMEGPRCFCDLRAISTTAFMDENFGRRFWGCVKYKMCPYGRRVIRQLRAMQEKKIGEETPWKNMEAISTQHRCHGFTTPISHRGND
ncbi:hypothetical protein CJ030_MR8G000297 [Morella rubra]|uniref:Uncharacterized protein n=1 Tax=Morella rubra TaxID=262757 RepID=A0A6A1UPR0_9ROSI|nr:hypothetical protein CJ030_MR8G000297 [Morella rubra]